jgi:hypothetical protein
VKVASLLKHLVAGIPCSRGVLMRHSWKGPEGRLEDTTRRISSQSFVT